MALQFVFGNSVGRKSEYMYQTVIGQAEKHPDWQYLFVVPEQASLLAQKELVKAHPRHALGNIDILSFNRLAYRIFEEQNIPLLNILDDTGKAMILRRVTDEQKGSLTAFQKNLSRAGFIDELKSVVSEFYQYGIRREELERLVKQTGKHPLLQLKLKDFLTIYTCFDEKLQNEYITAEELLPMLCKVVEAKCSSLISNSVILLDGFTGFTPVQYQLLELLLIHSRHLVCSVTVGSGVDPYKRMESHELFSMGSIVVERMRAMAISHGISYGRDITVQENWDMPQGKSVKPEKKIVTRPEFVHMERQLFRYPSKPYRDIPRAVSIFSAKNPQQEVNFLLQEILRLIREEGYEYRDIGVAAGDLETYHAVIIHQFTRAGIPFFIDRKKNLAGNPLVELIRGGLEVVEKKFSYESVFYYLRNGLLEFDRQDVDELENYVIATGLHGQKRWTEEWTRSYRGFKKERLSKINETRKKVMEPFETGIKSGQTWTVRERTEALVSFLQMVSAEERMKEMAEQFGARQEFHLQKEYEQAYGKLMELLDQFVDLMGDEKFSLETYREILDAGLQDIQVGLIPPTIDRLVVGDILRTRLGSVKALFVLGVNDGLLPRANERGGLISDMDREWIRDLDVELAPTAKEDGFTQKYYMYLMMTKPSQKLCMLYSRLNREGKAIRPSYLIGTVKKLFPRLEEQVLEEQMKGIAGMRRPEDSMELLIEGIRQFLNGEDSDWWKELYSWYARRPEYRKRLDNITEGLFYSYRKEALTKQAARKLFLQEPMNSVTRLERFASCAYAHFLAYGLGLTPRVEYQISAVDYGNIFHKSIEAFFARVKEENLDWTQLTVDQRMEMVSKSVESVAEEYGNTIFQSSARNQYLVQRMQRITDRTIWALSEQWRQGEFEQSQMEAGFSSADGLPGMELALEQGIAMALQGRIDRIDVAEKDNAVYVKVIDYKSGSTDFDLTKIYHGLQLQLIIYLEAAMEMEQKKHPEKKMVPAGIYYYHIKDPIVEQENVENREEAQKAIRRELRLSGLSNQSPEVLDMLDHSGNKKSEIIKNLERDNAGLPTRRSAVADSAQMEKLCGFGLEKAKQLGKEMLDGKIEVNPYEYKKKSPCDYCEFLSVCGFDNRIAGFGCRRLSAIQPDEMWNLLDAQKAEGRDEAGAEETRAGSLKGKEESLKDKKEEEGRDNRKDNKKKCGEEDA